MGNMRRAKGLRPELTELKAFCRRQGIWFNDEDGSRKTLFYELLSKISENVSQSAQNFMANFKETRKNLLQETINDSTPLIKWLYENQGERRFDAANRFFLILVDANNMEESWKLKRNHALLSNQINSHLTNMSRDNMENLKIEFDWDGETYSTYADILFVVVDHTQ
jgi:hypothetical protein